MAGNMTGFSITRVQGRCRQLLSVLFLFLFLVLVGNDVAYAGLASYTRILMADGSSRDIDKLKVGDQVIGTNGSRNRIIGIGRSLLNKDLLYALDGSVPFVTPDHPLLTVSGWKSFDPEKSAKLVPGLSVGLLRRGDTLMTPKFALPYRYLSEIQIGFPRHHVYVYDLHLNGDHTYYANGFVVHNSEQNDKGDNSEHSSDGESSDQNDGEKSTDSGGTSDSGDKQAGDNQGANTGAGGQDSGEQQSGDAGGSQGSDHGPEASGQSGNNGHEASGGQSESGGSNSGGANSGGGEGSNSGGANSGGGEGSNSGGANSGGGEGSGGDGGHGDYADEQAHQSESVAGNNEATVAPGGSVDDTLQFGPASTAEDSAMGRSGGITVHVRRSGRFGSNGASDGLGRGGDGRTIDLILQLPQGTRELSEEEERTLLQKRWQRGVQ